MRPIRYVVATSLDGYIAGPNGEFDWIVSDPEIDFGELFGRFDTLLMGRGTFELAQTQSGVSMPGMKTVVISTTLRPEDHPDVLILGSDYAETLNRIRNEPGKDIWLFGGGVMFRSLLEAGFVDSVEVAISPILLGGGLPMLPPPAERARLELVGHRVYRAGIVSLEYHISR